MAVATRKLLSSQLRRQLMVLSRSKHTRKESDYHSFVVGPRDLPEVSGDRLDETESRTREELLQNIWDSTPGHPKNRSKEHEWGFHGEQLWKWVSILFFLPATGLIAYNAYRLEKEHFRHLEEHGRDPFVPYTYLRKTDRELPWHGYNGLFFHPYFNATKDGYLDEKKAE